MGPLEAGRARVARAVEPFAVGTKAAVAVVVAVVAAAVQGSSKTGWVTGRLAVSRVARRLVARVCDFGELGELAGYHGTTSVTMVTRNLVPAYPHWWLFRKMVPAMQGHQVLGVVPR